MADVQFDENAFFKQYMDQGKSFGHTGKELQKFVLSRINEARDRHERRLERERDKEIERKEIERKLELELDHELKMEQEKCKLEQERLKQQTEQAKIKAELEVQKEETKRLQLQTSVPPTVLSSGLSSGRKQDLKLPKLANFRETSDDIDAYLYRFENRAKAQDFPKASWPLILSSHLEGKALCLFHHLAESGELSYETLKENLCKQFRCTSEGYRKQFRDAKPKANECFDTYSVELKSLLDRWITMGNIPKTYEDLRNMILSEQLMLSVSKDLNTFLREKNLSSFDEQISAAEAYRIAHPEKGMARRSEGSSLFASVGMGEHDSEDTAGAFSQFPQRGRSRFRSYRGHRGGRNNRRGRYSTWDHNYPRDFDNYGGDQRDFSYCKDRSSSPFRGHSTQRGFQERKFSGDRADFSQNRAFQDRQGFTAINEIPCLLCNRKGHKLSSCPFGQANSQATLCRYCSLCHVRNYCPCRPPYSGMSSRQEEDHLDAEVGSCCAIAETVEGVSEGKHVVCSSIQEFSGRLNLRSGKVNGVTCSVLRDTGATVCGVRRRLVHSDQFTGEKIKCVSFGGRVDEFPLAKVSISSEFISGEVVCCVLDTPVADLIVGNIPHVSDEAAQPSLSEEFVNAVTRSRSKHVVEKKVLQELPKVLDVTPAEISEKQGDDWCLSKCFEMAGRGEVHKRGSASFCNQVVNSILCRFFRRMVVCGEFVSSCRMTIVLSPTCFLRATRMREFSDGLFHFRSFPSR